MEGPVEFQLFLPIFIWRGLRMGTKSGYYLKWITIALSIFIILNVFFYFKYKSSVELYKDNFVKENTVDSEKKSVLIKDKITNLYQAIRTMSLLPGVRKMDRYAEKFDEDSKASVQQLYNNAVLNIKLSEVYLLPKNLDSDRMDPKTGRPEEPIMTFDEFIVADKKDETPEAPKEAQLLEELEIEEYQEMHSQLLTLAEKYSSKDYEKSFEVPMLVSKNVITCDNADMTPTDVKEKNDDPRRGFVFTVPVYDFSGHFKGGVSAVLRVNTIRNYLDQKNIALVNMNFGIKIYSADSEELQKNSSYFEKGEKNPQYIYSSQVPFKIGEDDSWQIWSLKNNDEFYNSEDYKSTRSIFMTEFFSSLLLSLGIILFSWFQQNGKLKEVRSHIEVLSSESKIVRDQMINLFEIGEDIQKKSTETAASFEETSASLIQISSLAKMNSEQSASAASLITSTSKLAGSGADIVGQLNSVLTELTIGTAKIKEMVSLIDDIAFQTNLLALNAAVEAARAGEQGKGFAVVADAVRNLAQKSAEAAKSINTTINENVLKISQSAEMAQEGNQSLCDAVLGIKKLEEILKDVLRSSGEQLSGVENISTAMSGLEQLVQSNAVASEKILESTGSVRNQSESMDESIEVIKKSLAG